MATRTDVAGRYRTRLKIQQRAAGQDAAGQPNGAWTDVCEVSAWGMSPTGMGVITAEGQYAGAESSYAQISWRIRWRTGLTAGMRAVRVLGGTVYDIRQVVPDEAGRRHVDLVCITGASQG